MKTTRSLILFLALALFGLVLLALSTPAARANPGVLRVKVNGLTSGTTCGGTWATACGLQHALTTVAQEGDELWVAAGTYTPTTGTDRTISFQLRPGVALYGGFAMTETEHAQRNFSANVTTLSGNINAQGTSSDNSYHVVMGVGVTNTAVLDGFTVTGGKADGSGYGIYGGGIYNNGSPTLANITLITNTAELGGGMFNDHGSPTLTNVNFISNTAGLGQGGGGIYNLQGSLTVTIASFSGNWAGYYGGGLYNDGSTSTLTNVTFSRNSADISGGGLYNSASVSTLMNVTFSGNTANDRGGGIYTEYSMPKLTNVTFSGNSANNGGGMYNSSSHPTLKNVTFMSNTANTNGGAISNNASSSPTISNTIVWANTPNGSQIYNSASTPHLNNSVVEGGYSGGTNIITADPRLGTLGNWGGSTQTVPLLPGSSAIDAGDIATCAPQDQRGKPRVGTCDIGAFEFQGYALTKAGGDHQCTLINTPFAHSLQISLTETGSTLPLPGVTVTFTAPSSGASAAWSGNLTAMATTDASGVATVGPPTANDIVGPYAITADMPEATAPVSFDLTNSLYSLYLPLIQR